MLDFDFDRMLFKISPEDHGKEDLIRILNEHPEVEFVSYAGIDIAGNDTDERIPVKMFINMDILQTNLDYMDLHIFKQ